MKLFGYEKNKEKKSLEINEATMICSKEELDKIIEYLQSISEEIKEEYIDPNEHWHYSDYNDDWTEEDSELVVFIDNIEKKTNY